MYICKFSFLALDELLHFARETSEGKLRNTCFASLRKGFDGT